LLTGRLLVTCLASSERWIPFGMVDTAQGACAAELLPAAVRGTGFGTLAAINGLGDTVSSIVVGLLWTAIAPAAGFGFGVVFAVAGVLLLPRVLRTPEPGAP
jgi:hypothetical protein